MSAAAGTENFGPMHSIGVIRPLDDVLAGDRLEKAGPAGPRMEFGIRGEQRQSAAGAGINPLFFVVQQRAAKCVLRPLFAQDAELFLGQLPLPFVLAQFDARRLDGPDEFPLSIEDVYANHTMPLLLRV